MGKCGVEGKVEVERHVGKCEAVGKGKVER